MQVKLFGSLRLAAGTGQLEIEAGPTVAAMLEAIFAAYPTLREEIVHPDRMELLPHVNIMRNGRLVRDLEGLQTPVREGDIIAIFPPAAGG